MIDDCRQRTEAQIEELKRMRDEANALAARLERENEAAKVWRLNPLPSMTRRGNDGPDR